MLLNDEVGDTGVCGTGHSEAIVEVVQPEGVSLKRKKEQAS